jgi:hypothetical protein
MKKILGFASAALLCLTLAACGGTPSSSYQAEENSFSQSVDNGTPGLFSLVSPSAGASLTEVPSFEWTASDKATYYTLEIASSETFITNNDAYVYYKHDYIGSTQYSISAALNQKNVNYYWRVTAHCGSKTTLCNNVLSFFLKSIDLDEVSFPIGEATDWSIHEAGAPVDVSINNSNFFGNGQESVCLQFTMEQTKAIGWIVATKTVELDTYGTDALYLRFFYSGQDATAYIRLRDNDGEFWRHKIQLANNSKQICIMPFSEFTQDTQLVTVNNHVFDYFHIKYLEIVFEQTWGDGVCLVSQISAIKKANYSSLFIKNLNFKDYDTSLWKWENDYNFGTDISEDGSTYTLHYDQAANGLNAVGMASKGYGFAKIYVNRFFDTGDMVHLKAMYTGASAGNLSFRLQEEDGDYWYYLQSFSTLSTTDYTDIYIPFEAFGATYLGGNGRREFSFILQLQFGLTNTFGTGTLSYKDVSIVSRSGVASIDCGAREVGEDGLIENFDSYATAAQPFYQWDLSNNNKDEFIALDSLKAIGSGNKLCGQMAYKADMAAATYSLDVNVASSEANAFSIWLKDASIKSDNSVFSYLESVSAVCTIGLTLSSGAVYYYQISAVSKVWTEYLIPFAAFSVASGTDALTPTSIAKVTLAFSYVYKTSEGTAYPTYMMSNPVYVDNLCLTTAATASESESPKERAIKADASDNTKATIENAEGYSSSAMVLGTWGYGNDYEGNNLELGDDVSSAGGSHSLKMNYKGYSSVSYVIPTTVDASVASTMKPKGLNVDLKGDGKATLYINLFILSGTSVIQVRKTIEQSELSTSWTHYAIGFGEFTDWVSAAGANVNVNNITNLFKISFGIVNGDYSSSAVYMDNLRLDNAISRTTDTATAIA